MERDGLASIAESSYLPVNFAMPRKQEIFACLNRYRGLRWEEDENKVAKNL